MTGFLSWVWLVPGLILYGCATSVPPHDDDLVASEASVLNGRHPALVVSRAQNDGQWVFLTDERALGGVVVFARFQDLLTIDATLGEVRDLPAGWKATRKAKGEPWVRAPLTATGQTTPDTLLNRQPGGQSGKGSHPPPRK